MAVNFFKTHHDPSQTSVANNKKTNTSQKQTNSIVTSQSQAPSQPKYRFYDELKKRNAEVQKELQQKMQEESKTSNIKGRNYRIQIGAFSEKESADRIRARMILRDYPVEIINNGKLYLVQIGPYVDRAEAVKVQKRIEREGIRETVLKAYIN
ncbi:SPOR domain-containing protein [Suttonella ornithocola]|nr:SPOR domain-containing protein [Suttonella ornithocola]